MLRRSSLALAVLATGLLGFTLTTSTQGEEAKTIKLFNGKDLTGWKVYLKDKDAKPEETFSVKEGEIHCTGKPNGYIITDKEYGNYELRLKWRWASKPGNSGVFVHVSGPDKIWPKGAEAQLMADHAGDFWLVDGFKLEVDKERQDPKVARHYFRMKKDEKIEKPVGEWNEYVITCKGDTIRLVINGTVVNEGKGAGATRGKILLQSEGAPVQFKDITLTPIK